MTIGQEIDGMLAKLERQRDELKLQAHLFRAEARSEWEKTEARWKDLQSRSRKARGTADEVGEDVAGAIRNVGREILEGYKKIRKSI